MNKKLLTFTYVMFGIVALLAVIFLAFLAFTIFVAQNFGAIAMAMMIELPLVLLTLHYLNCIKAIKNTDKLNAKKYKHIKIANEVWACIFAYLGSTLAVGTLFIVVWTLITNDGIDNEMGFFLLYFFAVVAMFALYTVNLVLIHKYIKNNVSQEILDMVEKKDTKTPALQHYKFEAKPELADIIDDSVTFAVLKKILRFNCTDIFTNHQTFVICYSNAPYPIWIWCKRPYDEKDTKLIADILKAEFLDKGDYRLIISEDLLQELSKTHHVFAKMHQKMQLFSYELRQINAIDHKCDGQMRRPKPTEIDTLAMHYHNASNEMEGHDFSMEDCKKIITGYMQNDELFVWVDDNDQIIATVNKTLDGNYAKIAFVYTLPTHRRKGYAINLVHKVSQMLLDDGLIPILYTNGGYVASNECYKKIGYVQVGKLVDVCVDKTDKLD